MGRFFDHNLPRYLTGAGAVVLSLYFLLLYRAELPVVAASIYFLLACTTDTLQSRIPNILNLLLLISGVTINVAQAGGSGLLTSILGLLLGVGLLLLPYMLGGFGAGDVKALGALGALTGPVPLLHVFVYMALFGGGMAILHYLFSKNLKSKIQAGWICVKASALCGDIKSLKPDNTEPLRFPYAAAIAFGYYTYIVWGELVL